MMIKKIGWCFLFSCLFLVQTGAVFAGTFNIKSIGGADTDGKQISHWWVTSLQPVFRGEAVPGANVSVTIDGTALQVTADSSGDWVFTPVSALSAGDHSVIASSEGSNISFTLTTGRENVDWAAVEKGTAEALPTVGVVSPTFMMLVFGVVLAGIGVRIGRVGTRE